MNASCRAVIFDMVKVFHKRENNDNDNDNDNDCQLFMLD